MKPLSWSFTAKIPYGENSVRQNFYTAKIPHGENSLQRKIFTAKFPYGKNSVRRKINVAKNPTAKIPTAKIPAMYKNKVNSKMFLMYLPSQHLNYSFFDSTPTFSGNSMWNHAHSHMQYCAIFFPLPEFHLNMRIESRNHRLIDSHTMTTQTQLWFPQRWITSISVTHNKIPVSFNQVFTSLHT